MGTCYSGGPTLVQCPQCDRMIEFNDWWRVGGPPFAVGFLGLPFWNWPELSGQFVQQVEDRLGHLVVVTGGQLLLANWEGNPPATLAIVPAGLPVLRELRRQ